MLLMLVTQLTNMHKLANKLTNIVIFIIIHIWIIPITMFNLGDQI